MGPVLVFIDISRRDEKVKGCLERLLRVVDGLPAPFYAVAAVSMLATRSGVVKKTPLEEYKRRRTKGLIAVKLRDGDELVDAVITRPGDELVLSTAKGMAIRFPESDARPMGRDTSGVRGIKLGAGDRLEDRHQCRAGRTHQRHARARRRN
jgi:DNA gyrase/topoisomerase IV subunit A